MAAKNFYSSTLAVVIKFNSNNPRELAIKSFLESMEQRYARCFVKTVFSLEFTKGVDYTLTDSDVFNTTVLSEKLADIVSKYAKPLTRSGDNIFWLNFSKKEKDYGSVVPVAYLLGEGFSSYFFTLMEKYYSAFIDAFMTTSSIKEDTILAKEVPPGPANPVIKTPPTPPPVQRPKNKEELMAYMKSLSANNVHNATQNNMPV